MFCQGFGFSSYSELTEYLKQLGRNYQPTSDVDLMAALLKGFTLAFEVAKEYGFAPRLSATDTFPYIMAEMTLEELIGVDAKSNSDDEVLMQQGWAILDLDERAGADPSSEELLSAEAKFKAAIAVNSGLAHAYNGLAVIDLFRERFVSAQKFAETALDTARKQLGDDSPEAYGMGDWAFGAEQRPYMESLCNLGRSLAGQHQYARAAEQFEEHLKRDTRDGLGLRFEIGGLYQLGGDLQRALDAHKRAGGEGDHYSENAVHQFNYAFALLAARQYDEAVARFRYASFLNLYIPKALWPSSQTRYKLRGSLAYELAYQAERFKTDFGELGDNIPGMHQFVSAIFNNGTVKNEIATFLKAEAELSNARGIEARRGILGVVLNLRDMNRILETNAPIVEEVTATLA
jgi:tetratricopeptide (TPR) repeat protein